MLRSPLSQKGSRSYPQSFSDGGCPPASDKPEGSEMSRAYPARLASATSARNGRNAVRRDPPLPLPVNIAHGQSQRLRGQRSIAHPKKSTHVAVGIPASAGVFPSPRQSAPLSRQCAVRETCVLRILPSKCAPAGGLHSKCSKGGTPSAQRSPTGATVRLLDLL